MCDFRTEWCVQNIINGSVLTLICLVGFLLNTFVIYLILWKGVRLPGHQTFFVVNLALTDMCLALLGVLVRGPGFVSPKLFLGGTASSFCTAYAFIIMFFGYVNTIALIPITLDRFIAIVLPWKYAVLFCRRNITMLIIATWVPNVIFVIVELGCYFAGVLEISYRESHGRCAFNDNWTVEKAVKDVVCLWLPLLTILAMYSVLSVSFKKKDRKMRRLLFVSSFVIIPSILSWLPYFILNASKLAAEDTIRHWTYIVFFLSTATNPLVYIFGYTNIRSYLRGNLAMRSKNQCSVCPENLKKEILTGSGRRISTQIYSECQVQMVKRPTTSSSLATLHVNKMSRTSSPLALLNNGTKSTALLTEK